MSSTASREALESKDAALLRLFLHTTCHQWPSLAESARCCLESGASSAELQGCIRHVCVVAGYPPALAAAKKLHAAGLIKESLPGKTGGQPGNAFELVYAAKRDKVWENLFEVDPILSEWIRVHCYGDIYSSPGLDLRQKQLMTAAFLAEADMHDEFFGHAIAGLRFGSSCSEILQAVDIAFECAGSRDSKQEVYTHAVRLARKAAHKVAKDFPGGVPPMPTVVQDNVRIPELPPRLEKVYYDKS